ncbi:MAG TPA: hypothetical protein ENN85_08250 [Methanoculleus sp.]|nr:hypothetical protein [Methanoculleus sp.]
MNTRPRPVTREDIEAFEKQYPLYQGIGRIMIREGIWILVESHGEQNEPRGGSPEQQLSRTVSQAANGTRHHNHIKLQSIGGGCW